MELWVGGGADNLGLGVSLWIDGVQRFSATGCDSGLLGRRLWYVAKYKGQMGVMIVLMVAIGFGGYKFWPNIEQQDKDIKARESTLDDLID